MVVTPVEVEIDTVLEVPPAMNGINGFLEKRTACTSV
jgi:hypothetical protein